MAKKLLFLTVTLVVFMFISLQPVKAEVICGGSCSLAMCSSRCVWSTLTARYTCSISSWNEPHTCGGTTCVGSGEFRFNCDCIISSNGGSCSTVSEGSSLEICTAGCTSCDNAICSSATTSTQACGSTTIANSCTAQCGNTLTWNTTGACRECQSEATCGWTNWNCSAATCNECVSCALRCGQALSCGGACSNVDNGAPVVPTLVSPIGSAVAPIVISTPTVNLQWNAVGGVVDSYDVLVERNSDGADIWTNNTVATSVTTPAVFTPGIVYRWSVSSVNTTCTPVDGGTDRSNYSSFGYFRINRGPTAVAVSIQDGSGDSVAVETGNRNQICQLTFQDDPQPRRVIFNVTLRDLDGWSEIQTGQMRWNGVTYNLVLQPGAGTDRVGTVTIDFGAGDNNGGVFEIYGLATDPYTTSGFVNLNRFWKVWDCEVPVGGNVFDGSPIIACPGTGFTNLASAEMNFTSLTYTQTNNGQVYNMSVTAPATYTDGGNNLIWGRTYNFAFNPDIAATGMNYRINGGNCSNLASVVFDQTRVDAYVAAPSAVMDFAWIRNQAGWYQIRGSGIEARNVISSAVPVTCLTPGCTPGLVMGGVGVSSDGLVAAQNINSSSGCTWGSGSGQCYRSYPRDTYVERNILSDRYSYETIKNSYWGRYGLGTTLTGDQSLDNVLTALSGGTGVAFVQGDLNITANNTLPSENFLMVVVSGRIIVDPTVTAVAGVFVSNGDFVATGAVDDQLVISGIIYSLSDVSLTRVFNVGSDNNATPAIVVNYRPDLVFSMPAALTWAISLRY